MSTLFISWSSLKVHEECKMHGRLQRTGHRAPLRDQRLFFAGNVVDRTVRDWLAGAPEANPGGMIEMVEEITTREKAIIEEQGGVMRWKSATDRDETMADCREAVRRLEPVLMQKVVPFDYDVDYGFKVPIKLPHPRGGSEIVVLNGKMDIIVRESIDGIDYWDIWDVKMTRDNSYWRKTAGQITFYDVARGLHLPGVARNSGLLQPMCDEQVKPYPVTEALRSQMKSRIAGMALDVFNENYELAESRSPCYNCDTKHACSRFKPVVSNGQRRISLV